MKKLIIIAMLVLANVISFAQNYDTLYIVEHHMEVIYYCTNANDGVVIYGRPECPQNEWRINGQFEYGNFIVLSNNGQYQYYWVSLSACYEFYGIEIYFTPPTITNPFTEPFVWKRTGEPIELYAPGSVVWSTGETENEISVTAPGTYSVTITDACGSETYSVEVRDNVELYRATCDLRTNLNQVTWQTTPEQAEYVSAVNIYRNTYQLVATVPYLDGSFTDNIGSEATQWQYHLVAVGNDGDECPLPSYWKRTIHLDHVQGTGGGEILQWTPYEEESPAKNTVIYYSIYDVVDGEPNHVMDVGNFTNVYAYDPNDFNGYGTVAAVFAAKGERDLEDMAFSNMTADILDVGESMQEAFKVYPNPTNGTFTVAGASTLTVFNTLGQAVATSHSANGTHTFTLRSGIYFLKSEEGAVQKVVVE